MRRRCVRVNVTKIVTPNAKLCLLRFSPLLTVRLSVCLSVRLTVRPSACPSVRLPVRPSVCLFDPLPVCLSAHCLNDTQYRRRIDHYIPSSSFLQYYIL